MRSSIIQKRLAGFCVLMVFFLALARPVRASGPREVTDKELKAMRQQIEKEALALRGELDKQVFDTDVAKRVSIEYRLDAFRIDELLKRRSDIDYSTMGLVNATLEADSDYDDLLNKYYQKLLAKLSAEDKAVLKQTQKNWLQFRDSEHELNSLLTKEEYSGGGTAQLNIGVDCDLELTKSRVKALAEYLMRFGE
jgi:uncharacterized protein YecT (DUF1311 family)